VVVLEHGIGTISDDVMLACIMKLRQPSTWAWFWGLLSVRSLQHWGFCSYILVGLMLVLLGELNERRVGYTLSTSDRGSQCQLSPSITTKAILNL
jgi:hypothetical protein